MLLFARCRACTVIFAPLFLLVADCSLTASDVEPALPSGPVNNSSTLAYYANGRPVVANNSSGLISILLAVFGDSRAVVVGQLRGSTRLDLRAVDGQGAAATGGKYHALYLTLNAFHGTGTYALDAHNTYYQELTPHQSGQYVPPDPTLNVVPTVPAELTVTGWDATWRIGSSSKAVISAT